MMNTDKTLILALALACAACPAVAADAPQAAAGTAPAATSAAAAPAEAAAADKPAAPKPKRKKPKAAKPAAAEAKASDAQPADAQPVDAPAAGPAPSEPEPAGAATAPPATAMPQAARVRVKDRASASAAVAAARAAEATPEASSAPAAAGAAATPSAGEPAGAPVAQAAPAAPPPVAAQERPHDHADDHAHAKAQAAPEPEPAAPAGDIARAAECNPPFKSEIAALFDRWNASLRSGDPKKVVANYAPGSVLLPTVSDRARFTVAEKEEYFAHFLQRRPEGRIDDRVIDVDCNSATDSGLYTFRFGDGTQVKARYTFAYKRVDGEWLIASHHSSGMPQKTDPAAEPKPARAAAKPVEDTKSWVRFP